MLMLMDDRGPPNDDVRFYAPKTDTHTIHFHIRLWLDLRGSLHANLPKHHLHFSSIIMPEATLVVGMNEIDSNLGT